jgi:hypothetical protein
VHGQYGVGSSSTTWLPRWNCQRRMPNARAHPWRFKTRFRRHAFGWPSQPAITRLQKHAPRSSRSHDSTQFSRRRGNATRRVVSGIYVITRTRRQPDRDVRGELWRSGRPPRVDSR